MKITQFFILFLLACATNAQDRPNVIVIFTDDLGYGDLGCFGHPYIQTPHIDRMAQNGAKLTSFYVGANVCSPSRAALLTGRLPIRSGLTGRQWKVLFPFSTNGMPQSEITLPEALKPAGYATGMVGKWHLGHLPEFLPTRHGFDYYYGIPYSNDMRYDTSASHPLGKIFPKLYMLENEEVVIDDVDQTQLTKDYTEKVLQFIDSHKEEPFFMYYAPNFPHVPLYASDDFLGKSRRGLYGDVVEELDWSVGQIMAYLRENDLEDNTLVFFTSDNGPWTTQDQEGGSAGLLRAGKGSCWEGGMRVPAVVQWPGKIAPNQVIPSLGSAMDLFTTIVNLAGGTVPTDREMDGQDLMPVWTGAATEAGNIFYYYHGDELFAVRKGPWKMHLKAVEPYQYTIEYNRPQLYQLEHDPSEQYDVSQQHPNIIRELRQLAREHTESLPEVPLLFEDIDESIFSLPRR